MKEDLWNVFSFVFNIFIVIFSFFLLFMFIISLDAQDSVIQLDDFKFYSNLFAIFVGTYIIYRIISKQHDSVLIFSITYALWIQVLVNYFLTTTHDNIYSTMIVLYNFFFYTILFIHAYWKEKHTKFCSKETKNIY